MKLTAVFEPAKEGGYTCFSPNAVREVFEIVEA